MLPSSEVVSDSNAEVLIEALVNMKKVRVIEIARPWYLRKMSTFRFLAEVRLGKVR